MTRSGSQLSFFEKGFYIGLCVRKWGKYWATPQSCRRSLSVVINTLHVKAKCLPGSALMEHRSELAFSQCLWKDWIGGGVELSSQSVWTPSVITWSSWSTLVLQVLYLDAESLAQPPPNAFENVPHSSTGCGILASFNLFHSPNPSPNIPGNCFHLAPLDCCGAQVDSVAR